MIYTVQELIELGYSHADALEYYYSDRNKRTKANNYGGR